MIIKNLDNINYPEFIIVGAGPAGITLALELEKKNLSSLLIESGGLEITEKDQSRYKGNVYGDRYFDLDVTRLSFFGGSSNHWGGNCAPLDEIDFTTWPIKKNELDKYESGTRQILEIKNPFEKYIKTKLNSFNLSSMEESAVNFKDKYYEKIKNSKKILLLLNTNVECFMSSETNPRNVDKLILNNFNNKYQISFNKKSQFILACGGIENSRILLWSKIKSKNNFLKNLPIGNYWMEHPTGEIGQFVGEKNKIEKLFENKKNYYLVPSKEFIIEKKINNIRFNIFFWETLDQKTFKHKIKDLICLAPNLGKKIIENISSNIVHCLSVIQYSAEQKPDFENKITLSNFEKDNFDVPKINLNWSIKDDVFNSLRVTLEELGEQIIENDIGRVGIDKYVYESSFKESNDIFGNHHHMGGTTMNNKKFLGVVDKNLKINDVDNFYVLGSSVFPSGGHFNPTYTIIQLALRLSDHLKEKL